MLSVLTTIGIVLGIIIGAYIVFMLCMGLLPRKPVPLQPLTSEAPAEVAQPSPPRKEVSFEVNGTAVSGWLYLPADMTTPAPCIVMGHGLGVTKSSGLEYYAANFQQAGLAVLAFDYRHLGESGGEPRQLVWIPRQLEDYTAAVAYARSLPEIDSAKIGLWGTSLSGGHVIVTAGKDQQVACVVAQVPLLAGDAGGMEVVRKLGFGYMLKMAFGHGLRDLVRGWLGLSPHKIPLAGQPRTIAAMADAGAWEAFNKLVPADFVNEVCARILVRMDKYHPIKYASKINCPVLLQICEQDLTTTPPKLVEKAMKQLGDHGEVIRYPIDHFDVYLGENLERAVADQVEFYTRHL
jgi:dienelactone hydrolase